MQIGVHTFIYVFYVSMRQNLFTYDLFFIWWLSNCRNDPYCVMGAFYQYIYFPSQPSLGMISRCSGCRLTAAQCTHNNSHISGRSITLLNGFVGNKGISKHKSFYVRWGTTKHNSLTINSLLWQIKRWFYEKISAQQKDGSNFTTMPCPHHVAIFIPSP